MRRLVRNATLTKKETKKPEIDSSARRRVKKIAAYGAYAVYCLIVVAIGLEVALRLIFSDPNYYWDHRYLFASEGAFHNLEKGLWAYTPRGNIRSVGAYGFPIDPVLPAARFRIEYDCLYPTNNIGLVQQSDVKPGEHATVVLGDSFTEGQGGCPWFPGLEKRMPDARLVNGGLQGSGPE